MRQGHERVHGPYQHGNRWRVTFVGANGARSVESFASRAEAEAEIEKARATAGNRTIGDAMMAYLATRTDKERRTVRFKLDGVLGNQSRQLASLTAPLARSLYAKRAAGWERQGAEWVRTDERALAGATLHGELRYARQFCDWCVARGWLRVNPFAEIEPVGEVNRGKPQHRVDEARRLLATLSADKSPEATAVMMAQLMGVRAHEIVERIVRDLDDNGRLLWITKSKTAAGKRQLAIPVQLRDRLMALANGKRPDERIFGEMTRYALHYHVVRFCELACVPRVTPHGLRGTFATLAVTAGLPGMRSAENTPVPVADTARMLGHADAGETMRRHYMAPGAEESANAQRVEELLGPMNVGTQTDRDNLN